MSVLAPKNMEEAKKFIGRLYLVSLAGAIFLPFFLLAWWRLEQLSAKMRLFDKHNMPSEVAAFIESHLDYLKLFVLFYVVLVGLILVVNECFSPEIYQIVRWVSVVPFLHFVLQYACFKAGRTTVSIIKRKGGDKDA